MKFVLALMSLLVASALVAGDSTKVNQPGCGRRPFRKNKVVGGKETAVGDHGWTVGFYYNGSFRCGGSLINDRWILTAAHCVTSVTSTAGVAFYIGGHRRGDGQMVTADKVIRHASYNSGNFQNDVALYRLSQKVNLSNTVMPVCLHEEGSHTNDISWAAGWGTMSNGALATVKQEVDLKIVEQECVAYYGSSYHAPTMICAGIVGDGKDTCQGDSGGPYVCERGNSDIWEKVGVTSWGRGCGDIGVCARVSNYVSWVKLQLEANP